MTERRRVNLIQAHRILMKAHYRCRSGTWLAQKVQKVLEIVYRKGN